MLHPWITLKSDSRFREVKTTGNSTCWSTETFSDGYFYVWPNCSNILLDVAGGFFCSEWRSQNISMVEVKWPNYKLFNRFSLLLLLHLYCSKLKNLKGEDILLKTLCLPVLSSLSICIDPELWIGLVELPDKWVVGWVSM